MFCLLHAAVFLIGKHHFFCNPAADGCNFPFEVPDSGLPRIFVDDAQYRIVVQPEVFRFQTVFGKLLCKNMTPRNFLFFMIEISGKFNHFHPVLQRKRYGITDIRRCDEHDLGEIVIDIEIMIVERRVLLRIENLQKRRRRIAAEIHAHLVHFIHKNHGIHDAGALHRLDYFSRHRTDIRSSMAANFRFIPYAAQRHADKFSSKRARNRFCQRRLAYSRRSYKAKDLPLHFFYQIQNGNMLQYAFFRFI